MDMVPVYADEPSEGGAPVPGTVKISSRKQQMIGVNYGEVSLRRLSKTIRTVGRVVYDETRISRIQSRVDGWIDQVYVNFTGKSVKKGRPLFTVYSPDLFSTQQELLIAKKAKDSLAGSDFADVGANALSLYNATRERLRLWNISDRQIREVESRGAPIRALTFSSPIDGFVLNRNAFPGQRITAETELYSIADLSTVWVMADVYEYEVPMVKLGQEATMTLAYAPGETFRGKIAYINPQMDNTTRTLKVRIQFPNPGFRLKPDMYADVQIKIDYGRKVSVPEEAVLDSGMEQIVFVAKEGGAFEPRKVKIGAKVDGRIIILKGLEPGEKIVTSGNFLIDSESRLRSATGDMMKEEPATEESIQEKAGPEEPAEPAGASEPSSPPVAGVGHSKHQMKPRADAGEKSTGSPSRRKEQPANHGDHSQHQAPSGAPPDHSTPHQM